MLFVKQSFYKNIIMVLALSLIAAGFLINEILSVQSRIQSRNQDAYAAKKFKTKWVQHDAAVASTSSATAYEHTRTKPAAIEPYQAEQIEPIFNETVMQVNYQDNTEIIDAEWREEEDEEVIRENNRLQYESMSQEEIAIKKQIDTYESQLIDSGYDRVLNADLEIGLLTLFEPENETDKNPLVDIQCNEQICRVALDVPDEAEQDDAIARILDQFDTIEHQATDVIVRNDDSRLVTVYLKRDYES